ncbi:aromatic ring-hydroxylating oxygenase subunit alpha [Chachezhania sediminis]|uniref:aromatic ring-hydroxylating oxygenase subunit alpha n=1 Tax=Chachezhania sediminis TaxID=2599291 RepID=UPI00131CD50B|nr:aromatic ring-hydroxylating dioxygenase subunit alpha [Chachezhania sediminis]
MATGAYRHVAEALRQAEHAGYDEAWSMPRAYYVDPGILAEERERLFGTEWICFGRAEEVGQPGDYLAFQLCDEPLVAVRGQDGVLRLFSNVCRHRGAVLAEGKGRHNRLVCPYHHWSYDLDGKLAGAPRMEEHRSFDPAACALPQFAVEEWHGFLFANLSDNPPPLSPRLQGLSELIRNYHMEEMKLRYVADEIWHTNWKCLIENFMEGYHLSPLHKTTLHPVNPTRLCSHFPAGDAYFGYNAGYSPDLPRSNAGHPDLTEAEVDNCVMFAVPPGLVSGCGGDYSSFICIQPESIDRVRARMGLIFYGEGWTDEAVENAVVLFNDTMAEDKEVLIGLMRGMGSQHHQAGPLAPAAYEGPVLDFYRYYSRRMADPLGAL